MLFLHRYLLDNLLMLLKCFFLKDEQGAAASLSVTLDTELGDFPVQHRVVSI